MSSQETVIRNPQIFSGFSHIGSCREFVLLPGGKPGDQRFLLRNLHCADSFDTLMLRKDLYLCAESGEEFMLKDFRLFEITDPDNIMGVAQTFAALTEKFPEVKSDLPVENGMISQPTQLQAIRAVSSMINAVQGEQRIQTRETREVAAQLAAEVARTPDAILNLMAVRNYDDYTYAHNINVATLALLIGHAMGLPPEALSQLGVGALLHDIGKLRIALTILNKEGPLDEQEFDKIRMHPKIGYDLLARSVDIPEVSKLIVLQHHEKFQGSGYPYGLKGGAISQFARIVAVADVYDALTTARPFRQAMSPYLATKILLSNTENQFDPGILAVFVRRMSIFPPGSRVRLSDGTLAMVVRSNPGAMLRPVVRLLMDAKGGIIPGLDEIDLLLRKNLYVRGPMTV